MHDEMFGNDCDDCSRLSFGDFDLCGSGVSSQRGRLGYNADVFVSIILDWSIR